MQMVFSSSCTVYGNPSKVPIDETHPLSAVSPYGRSKLIIEDMFRDLAASPEGKDWRIILLRYFNPVGAHPSGVWSCTVLLQMMFLHKSTLGFVQSYQSGQARSNMLPQVCLQNVHCKGHALALTSILHNAGGQPVIALALEGITAEVIDEPSALPLTLC